MLPDRLSGSAVKRVAIENIFLSRMRTLAFHIESYTGLPCDIFLFLSCFRPTVKRCEVEIAYSRKQAFKNVDDRF